jgi:predicted MFS family arabinose efflux permease
MMSQVVVAKTPRYAWVVVFVILFSALAGPINMFNVPPAALVVMESFKIDIAQMGMLVSVFAFAAVVMAFPAGIICDKLGFKAAAMISAILTALGALMACFVGTDYVMFLVARVIIGLGFGLFQVVWPPIISVWFPEKTRGFGLGIMGIYAPLGSTVAFVLFPQLLSDGLQLTLIVSAAWAVLAVFAVLFLYKAPKTNWIEEEAKGKIMPMDEGWGALFRNPSIWLVGIVFLVFAWIYAGGVNTYLSTYLIQDFSMDPTAANAIVSAIGTISCLGFVAGFIMDRGGTRKTWMIVFSAIYLISVVLLFGTEPPIGIWFGVVLMGIANCGIPTSVRTLAVENVAPGLISKALSLVTFCTTLGIAFGSYAYGAVATATSFKLAGMFLLGGLALISLICAFFIKAVRRSKDAALQTEGTSAVAETVEQKID